MQQRVVLETISRVYEAALSPAAYEKFAEQWDLYLGLTASFEDDPIAEHIDRALAIAERLEHAGVSQISSQSYLQGLSAPAALIDRAGQILSSNERWKDKYRAAQTKIWGITEATSTQSRIRDAIQEVVDAAKLPMRLLTLADEQQGGLFALSFRRMPESPDEQSNLICVQSSDGIWDASLVDIWRDEFDLTPAENELMQSICTGCSFSAISRLTGKSPETIKSQSKAIYRKLDVDSRESAILLAMRLHLLVGTGHVPSHQDSAAGLPQYVQLSSVQRIAVYRHGPAKGRPLLYLHGMVQGHDLPQGFIDRITRVGWQLIRVDRPGYGRSDPQRNWRSPVQQWVSDFPSLLEQLGAQKVTLMTHTSGIMYGCASATFHRHLVDGVFAISGGVPSIDEDDIKNYPAPLQRIVRTAKTSPQALRFFLSVASNYTSLAGGEDRFIRQSYATNPCDATALDDSGTVQALRQGLELIRDGGYKGFVGDAGWIFDDWSGWIERMQCPLAYANGTQDEFCPLDWARFCAQKYSHVTVLPVEGAGQLAQHTHADAIAGLFLEFARMNELV